MLVNRFMIITTYISRDYRLSKRIGSDHVRKILIFSLIGVPELEVFSIFKLHWDIGILGTVQACTVLNIAKLRMLE